jgi:hypothetical protein
MRVHAPSHPRECNRTAFRYLCVGRTPKPTAYALLLSQITSCIYGETVRKTMRRRRKQPKLSAYGRFCAPADRSWVNQPFLVTGRTNTTLNVVLFHSLGYQISIMQNIYLYSPLCSITLSFKMSLDLTYPL